MARKIVHVDLDAFYCSVEELQRPELAGKAFAVGGHPESRGVVSSCSYAARMLGVRSAMPMRNALRLCPDLIVLPGNYAAYSRASHQVMERFEQWTGLVEPISIDEAFLDLSDLPEPGEELARRLQQDIREHTGLPCSLGVAANKLVAKIATDAGKHQHHAASPPCAITVVPAGEEETFLSPLPVEALWGVGKVTAEFFHQAGIFTIGDLARLDEGALVKQFGVMGHELYLRARGIDDRPVHTEYEAKSISQEVTFDRDQNRQEALEGTLRDLSEMVGRRLRKAGLAGNTVKLKLRWPDFSTITRQVTLAHPTDVGEEIYQTVLDLFRQNWSKGRAVRLLGVGVSRLQEPTRQLEFWSEPVEKQRRLEKTLDELNQRYGKQAIQRGKKEIHE